jgi:hypothetical protein
MLEQVSGSVVAAEVLPVLHWSCFTPTAAARQLLNTACHSTSYNKPIYTLANARCTNCIVVACRNSKFQCCVLQMLAAGASAPVEPCPAASSASSAGGVRGWVSSMVAVWSNIGRAAAVGPTGKDVPKDEQFFDVSGGHAGLGFRWEVLVACRKGAAPGGGIACSASW